MKLYQRRITTRLFILRCISAATAVVCFLSFKDGHTNLGYFLTVVLIFLSLVKIEDLVIYGDHFEIKRFYLFGMLPVNREFAKKDTVVLNAHGADFGEKEGEGFSDVENPAGFLFYFYTLMFGTKSRVTHRKFSIKKIKETSFFNTIELFLNKEEYDLVKDILK